MASQKPRIKRNAAAKAVMVVEGTGLSGVPTRLTDVAIERVEALARTGLRQTSVAALLGISEDAWDRAKEQQPEVAAAFQRGRASLEEELAGMLVAQARKGNIAATIFALKNVANWSDGGIRGEQAPSLSVNINIPPAMTDEEFKQIVDGKATEVPNDRSR
jgi:hypothetical protein